MSGEAPDTAGGAPALPGAASGCLALEEFDAFIQRPVERLLLALQHFLHVLLLRADFGEDIAHCPGEDVDELVEERFVEAEGAAVAHGAAQDAAQDVVAVVVAGLDAVGDGEAQRADVVGDDAEGDVDFFLLGVAGAAGFGQRARRISCRSVFPARRRSGGRCRSRSWRFSRSRNR